MATEPTIVTGAIINGPPRKRLRSSWIAIDEGDFCALQQIFQFRMNLRALLDTSEGDDPLVEIGDDSVGNRVTKLFFVEDKCSLSDYEYQLAAPHVAELDALEALHLDSKLITLWRDAEWLGRMKRLKEITWEYDKENIPYPLRVIEGFPKLEKLDFRMFINGSYEEEKFSFIFDLKNLKELILDSVDGLPDKIQNMNNLKILRLDDMTSQAPPTVIWNLRNLESLKISGSDGKMIIPDDIERLTSLIELGLYGACQVSSLVGNLPNLKALHVCKKSIKSLAPTTSTRPSNDVKRFQKLEYVNMIDYSNEKFSAFSQEFAILQRMPNLKTLQLPRKICNDCDSYELLLELAQHCPFLGYIADLNFTDQWGYYIEHTSLMKKLRENRTRWVSRQRATLLGPLEVPVALWPLLLARAGRVLALSYAKFVELKSDGIMEMLLDASESDAVFSLLSQKAANDRLRSE